MLSSARFWKWVAGLTLVFGTAVEYYAHALGAFIVSDCPNLSASAPGECAWPYRLSIAGIAIMSAGALGCCILLARALFRKLTRRV